MKTWMRVAGAGDKPHSRFLASLRLELGVGGGHLSLSLIFLLESTRTCILFPKAFCFTKAPFPPY